MVMKKIFAVCLASCFFLVSIAHAEALPSKPVDYVNDFAHVLSPETAKYLEANLRAYEQQTTNEISVVTLDNLPDGRPIEDVANQLFRNWGIGKKAKNNGVLFLLAIHDHQMRIEVGYGLEGALTDIMTKRIQDDDVRPYLKNNDFNAGIRVGVLEIEQGIAGTLAAPVSESDQTTNQTKTASVKSLLHLVFFIFIILVWIFRLIHLTLSFFFSRLKSRWIGGLIGALLGASLGGIVSLFILPIFFKDFWYVPVLFFTALGLGSDLLAIQDAKPNETWWQYIQRHHGGGAFVSTGGSWGGFSGGSGGGFGGGSSGGGGSSSGW